MKKTFAITVAATWLAGLGVAYVLLCYGPIIE